MSGRVEGKFAVISGAARAQGRSHALRLAQEDADMIVADACKVVGVDQAMSPASSEYLAEAADPAGALDRRIVTDVVDLRDCDALEAAVNEGADCLGRLGIVDAGMADRGDLLNELDEFDWQRMLAINLRTKGLPSDRPLHRRQTRPGARCDLTEGVI